MDHINPVSKGGTNNLLNLVTSCMDCNRGKSNKVLSDDSVAKKQKKMADELAKRKEQIDMFMEWRSGLLEINIKSADMISEYIEKKASVTLTEIGKSLILNLVEKYPVKTIIGSIDESFEQTIRRYRCFKGNYFFELLPKVCKFYGNYKLSSFFYMRSIIRIKRIDVDDERIKDICDLFVKTKEDFEYVKESSKKINNYDDFEVVEQELLCIADLREYEREMDEVIKKNS